MRKDFFKLLYIIICVASPCVCCVAQENLHSSLDPKLPMHWGVSGLHSSVEPAGWVTGMKEGDKESAHAKELKEPIIPYANLEAKKRVQEEADNYLQGASVPYETGMATYYSAKSHGHMMASGKRYDKDALFCAHKKLPFGTMLRVVNKKNGKEVIVEVLDRGPFAKGRIVDLSNRAASEISMIADGVVPVEIFVLK